MINSLPRLKPGDVLLYSHKGFFDFLIREFTRSDKTHIEVVSNVPTLGSIGFMVAASRNGIGPNTFSFDPTVVKVLRPKGIVDVVKAMAWFNLPTVRGCGYGYWDLLKFLPTISERIPKTLLAKGMICSTFVDAFLRAGGFGAFADNFDPGEVTPRDFDESAMFDVIWQLTK